MSGVVVIILTVAMAGLYLQGTAVAHGVHERSHRAPIFPASVLDALDAERMKRGTDGGSHEVSNSRDCAAPTPSDVCKCKQCCMDNLAFKAVPEPNITTTDRNCYACCAAVLMGYPIPPETPAYNSEGMPVATGDQLDTAKCYQALCEGSCATKCFRGPDRLAPFNRPASLPIQESCTQTLAPDCQCKGCQHSSHHSSSSSSESQEQQPSTGTNTAGAGGGAQFPHTFLLG